MKRCLVTMVVGEAYQEGFNRYAVAGWKAYADKWHYDLHLIRELIDTSPRALARSAAWQKCLMFEYPPLKEYDQVAWVDCDILINPEAPNIFAGIQPHEVGAVRLDYHDFLKDRLSEEESKGASKGTYAECGVPAKFHEIVQTGVMVMSPLFHSETLRYVYDHYEDTGRAEMNFEMRPLSYELLERHSLHWLDPRFNVIWVHLVQAFYPFVRDNSPSILSNLGPLYGPTRLMIFHEAIINALRQSYFLHFAGTGFSSMRYVDKELILNSCQKGYQRNLGLTTS